MKALDTKELKYTIRQHYLAYCTQECKQPDFVGFYGEVAALAVSSGTRRIQRLTLAKRSDLITASRSELNAFAIVLGVSLEVLAGEAAKRVMEGVQP